MQTPPRGRSRGLRSRGCTDSPGQARRWPIGLSALCRSPERGFSCPPAPGAVPTLPPCFPSSARCRFLLLAFCGCSGRDKRAIPSDPVRAEWKKIIITGLFSASGSGIPPEPVPQMPRNKREFISSWHQGTAACARSLPEATQCPWNIAELSESQKYPLLLMQKVQPSGPCWSRHGRDAEQLPLLGIPVMELAAASSLAQIPHPWLPPCWIHHPDRERK